MSEKRETSLINLGIIKKTQQIFPEEDIALRASTNLMRRLTNCAEKALPNFDSQPNLRAIMELFCRNRELAHFSIICMVNAGYAETKILLRVSIENSLLMQLFKAKPELASEWFTDSDKFRRKWGASKIRKEVFRETPEIATKYGQFYGVLCDYTHPSFNGWYEIFKTINNRTCIGARPEFNADYASECIGLVTFAMIQSISVYVDVNATWIEEKTHAEVDNLLSKLQNQLTRHFEVRKYKKGKLLGKD